MVEQQKDNIALFIDCDNISHRAIDGIITELSRYGVVNIRQAYGNWSKENLKNWEEKLLEYAIKPIQQFDYSKNKNATDILMTIDTIDLLHTKKIDAFAFATSDSDFTPVVMRVLSEGIKVFGFGEKKTPKPLVRACSQFIYTESFLDDSENKDIKQRHTKRKGKKELLKDKWLVQLLQSAVEQSADEYGWANLADVGTFISNSTSFSPINYGYKKLSAIIKEIDLFDIAFDEVSLQMSIRDKRFKSEF